MQITVFREVPGIMVVDIENPVACPKQPFQEGPVAVQGNVQDSDGSVCQLCYPGEEDDIAFDPGYQMGVG
jgi:hypothetical protein